MAKSVEGSTIVETPLGTVEYVEQGEGAPLLFTHGSPGGADQGIAMTRFLAAQGFRAICISRPGYLGTPLAESVATPDQQADLELALMDALGVEQFPVMCWSGGGPSTYRLAAKHGDRVTALVMCAAISNAYDFGNGINAIEYSLLTGAVGNWLLKEMTKHTPKAVVDMVGTEEGDLTKEQAHALSEHIWNDEAKREFVMEVSATISGRHDGLKNDQEQFPQIRDLGLRDIRTPVLLLHGTADSDVHPDQSEHALELLPEVVIHRIPLGTHLAVWTDPTADTVQAAIIEHLKG